MVLRKFGGEAEVFGFGRRGTNFQGELFGESRTFSILIFQILHQPPHFVQINGETPTS